jgi:hypothetical protein
MGFSRDQACTRDNKASGMRSENFRDTWRNKAVKLGKIAKAGYEQEINKRFVCQGTRENCIRLGQIWDVILQPGWVFLLKNCWTPLHPNVVKAPTATAFHQLENTVIALHRPIQRIDTLPLWQLWLRCACVSLWLMNTQATLYYTPPQTMAAGLWGMLLLEKRPLSHAREVTANPQH